MNDNFSSSEELPLPTQIMKHIYLGSEWNSANLEQLAELNITHIVNCDIHSRNHFTNSLFTYCNIHLDEMSPNILPEMDVCFQFIDTARKQEKNVLVHCRTGITKSAAICVGYLMGLHQWSLANAYVHVKRRRPEVDLKDFYLYHLLEFERLLFGDTISDKPHKPLEGKTTTLASRVPSLVNIIMQDTYDTLLDSIEEALRLRAWKELARCRRLLSLNPFASLVRRAMFIHVKQEAKAIMPKFEARQTKNPTDFVDTMCHFTRSYTSDVKNTFPEEHVVILTAMELECQKYLAAYAHHMLAKPNCDEAIENIAELIKHYREHGLFDSLYASSAANRVLSQQTSIDTELTRTKILRNHGCGNLADILEEMMKDMKGSEDIMEDFKFKHKGSKNVTIQLLSSNKWPYTTMMSKSKKPLQTKSENYIGINFDDLPTKCVLPTDIESQFQQFVRYHDELFNGSKRLRLAPHLGFADMEMNINNKRYVIQVSTCMMVVLYLFNDANTLNYEDIKHCTAIEDVYLKQTLSSLCASKLLLKHPADEVLKPGDSFTLNTTFTHKTNKFKVTMVPYNKAW